MARQFRSDDTDQWKYGFGSGADGALTISSNTTFSAPNAGCSGTSGSTGLIAQSAVFNNGDLVLIHQTRGTGAGNWELNKVASGGGGTFLTMKHPLQNTYTNGAGADQTQMVKLYQYSSATVNSGVTWSAPNWDQDKGGILAFLCKGTVTVNGTISANGTGFRNQGQGGNQNGTRGEGTAGAGTVGSSSPNGNGGGAGADYQNQTGGGGGHASAGTTLWGGQGGSAVGNAGLTSLNFGGQGGGASSGGGDPAVGGAGGAGGGIVLIIAKDISISSTGLIRTNGNNGSVGDQNGGGGGAGGSVLLKGQTVALNTSKVTASAGSGGDGSNRDGGAGSVGRIHLDYKTSYTGTTSPTLDARQDSTLKYPTGGGAFLYNFL